MKDVSKMEGKTNFRTDPGPHILRQIDATSYSVPALLTSSE